MEGGAQASMDPPLPSSARLDDRNVDSELCNGSGLLDSAGLKCKVVHTAANSMDNVFGTSPPGTGHSTGRRHRREPFLIGVAGVLQA